MYIININRAFILAKRQKDEKRMKMNKNKFIITSLFAALVLSGCKIELGEFVKQSGPISTDGSVSLPPLGDDVTPSVSDEGDASANADFISELNADETPGTGHLVAHFGWPTAQIQSYLASLDVTDTIPNIILNRNVYIDDSVDVFEFGIIVFGENPTLAAEVATAHINAGWKDFTEEGSSIIAVVNDAEQVFLMAAYMLEVTDGEDFNHPTLTMFVYGVLQDDDDSGDEY